MNAAIKKKLCTLELQDLARVIELQECDLSVGSMSFDERLEQLLMNLISERENRHIKRLINNAHFKYPQASIETLDCESRGVSRDTILHLANMKFIDSTTNLIITGPAGAGKTYLACALGIEACKKSFRTYYVRMPDMIRNFENLRDNLRELKKYQRRIGNYHVLIIDEWLSNKLTEKDSKWIYELMEQRSGNNPTILIGQFKSDEWFERLGGGTLADSIMDRIIHNSYPISTKETNLRQIYDNRKLQELLNSFKE